MKVASRRKYHIIYRTTCIVTNRFYIGMHSTDDLNDRYLGSGVRLRRSVAKHGADYHTREVLEILPSRQAASDREKELLSEELRADPLCMNCGPGGLGATDRPATTEETRAKLSASGKGKKRTNETRARMSEASRESQGRPEVAAKKSAAQKARLAEPGRREKMTVAQLEVGSRPHIRALRAAIHKKPCTIDGVTIFPSRNDLILALGKGRNGLRSSTFRYV